jgi:hypothetical protein
MTVCLNDHEMASGEHFCGRCGSPAMSPVPTVTESAAASLSCTNGHSMEPGQAYCDECGSPPLSQELLNDTASVQESLETSDSEEKKTESTQGTHWWGRQRLGIRVAIVILVAAIATAAVVVPLTNGGGPTLTGAITGISNHSKYANLFVNIRNAGSSSTRAKCDVMILIDRTPTADRNELEKLRYGNVIHYPSAVYGPVIPGRPRPVGFSIRIPHDLHLPKSAFVISCIPTNAPVNFSKQ